jgi:hypothetical protein
MENEENSIITESDLNSSLRRKKDLISINKELQNLKLESLEKLGVLK